MHFVYIFLQPKSKSMHYEKIGNRYRGNHGFDNNKEDMRSIFLAFGPSMSSFNFFATFIFKSSFMYAVINMFLSSLMLFGQVCILIIFRSTWNRYMLLSSATWPGMYVYHLTCYLAKYVFLLSFILLGQVGICLII